MTLLANKADPTRTTLLRKKFSAEMNVRFRWLKGRILDLIVKEDALGLSTPKAPTFNKRWQFNSNPQKVKNFQGWLREQVNAGILETSEPLEQADAEWINPYITKGYNQGAQKALTRVKAADPDAVSPAHGYQVFEGPFGVSTSVAELEMLQTRAFTELHGITEAMDQQITRSLTEGLLAGKSPREIAADINSRIDAVGKRRALTLARTEIIRAHAEGAISAMEAMGVTEIGVEVEWSTTGDARVCPLCSPLEGVVIPIKKARGMFPRHPNCRCSPIPAFDQVDQSRLKKAILSSVKSEVSPKGRTGKKRSLKTRKKLSRWLGAGKVKV